MKLNKMFDEFNGLYGLETKSIDHKLDSMLEIVGSEFDELSQEVEWSKDPETFKPEDLVKECIDVVYAQLQQLRERGVDIDAALAEVHRSNMSKASEQYDDEAYLWAINEKKAALARYPDADFHYTDLERYVIKCGKTGKVIKPTTYSPAVITDEMIGR